jgi:SAM-dependent methyltransferase
MNNNPWLKIPLSDYENHMSSPEVCQLQMLNQIFKRVYVKYKSKNILIVGCTSGNGFEHVDFSATDKVVGIDINPDYLKIAENKYGNQNGKIELRCCDICNCKIEKDSFDLIHCGLVFEYAKPEDCIETLNEALKHKGILSVILQLPGEKHAKVSETEYSSLKKLESAINLVEPVNFKKLLQRFGIINFSDEIIRLKSGKEFYFGEFIKQ